MLYADDSYLVCVKTIYEKFPNVGGLLPPNIEQRAAVRSAMFQQFAVIQGPPGTGKTVTVVRLAALYMLVNEQLDSRYRQNNIKPQVMICGPSNKSVDVIAGIGYARCTHNAVFTAHDVIGGHHQVSNAH